MKVSLATPERMIFTGEAEDVLLNTEVGQIEILDRHANLISLVHEGLLRLRFGSSAQNFQVSEGVVKVEDNQVSVLCNAIQEA